SKHFRAKEHEIPKDIWDDNKDPKYTGYEEVKGHWQYVEQLFPKLRIPTPPKKVSSTGWKAPSETLPNVPYNVGRTRNHMLPVYEDLETKHRFFTTRVKNVNGDIY
ncbi:large ribosomal subunit protein mL49-like, partial [Parasteatoda tepidariorum]